MRVKGQAFSGSVMAILFIAISLIIGMIVFSSVFQNTGNAPYTEATCNAATNCTYNVLHPPVVGGTDVVINCTAGQTLTRGVDYELTHANGTFQVISGDLNTSCSLPITYRVERITTSGGDATSELINTTTASAVNLATVGLIILAAITILGAVFLLGRKA